MALQHEYKVELMEPNTPWRYKASMLAAKNTHSVPITKIQKLLVDFEKNIDVVSLAGSCQKPLKPGNFIKNLDRYFEMNNDWNELQVVAAAEPDPIITARKEEEIPERTRSGKSTSPFSFLNENRAEAAASVDDGKINESKDLLKAMFADVDDDILVDFLEKYNNDVTVVTNILLDSLNLSEYSRETETRLCVKEDSEKAEETETESMSSLKSLCIKEMDRQEENVRSSDERKCELEAELAEPFLDCSLQEGSPVGAGQRANVEQVKHSNSMGNFRDCYNRGRNGKPYKPSKPKMLDLYCCSCRGNFNCQ